MLVSSIDITISNRYFGRLLFLRSDLSFCKDGFDQTFGLAEFGSTRFRTTDRLNRIPVLNEPRVHLNGHRARSKVVSVEDSDWSKLLVSVSTENFVGVG